MSESVFREAVESPEAAWAPPVLLRQAREAAGLHIAALAAALKVPVRKLEALEAGRYDELPDLTFARALASSACRQLKTDPAPILEQIPQGRMPVLGDSRQAINAPFKADQDGTNFQSLGWLRRPAVLLSLLALVGALVIALVPDWSHLPGQARLDDTTRTSDEGLTTETVLVPGTVPTTAETEPMAGTAPQASTMTDVLAVPDPDPAAAPAPAVAAASGSPAGPASAGDILSLRATSDAWVEVVDGVGKLQVQRVLKAGDVLSFSSAPPFSVVLGRADAVEVQVRGRPFDVMPYARNSVARFEVK